MDDEADDKAEKGRADPTKPRLGKRQNAAHSVQQAVQMAGRAKRIGQRAQQIVDRGDKCAADDPVIDRAVVMEKLAAEGQQDQRDRERIEEHQDGHGERDDAAEAEVCE